MAILLDGTTGITTPGLTNTGTETIVNLTTTGNTILGDASTDTLNVGNGGLVKNASGNVGIGTSSPSSRLDVRTSAAEIGRFSSSATNGGYQVFFPDNVATPVYVGSQKAILSTGNATDFAIVGTGANNMVFGTNATERMRIDSSGNVGIGVTPEAWNTLSWRALQINNRGAYVAATSSYYSGGPIMFIGNNGYDDVGAGNFKYTTTNAAAQYVLINNSHEWRIAASGTAGNAITWTQAMTLSTSGNLLVGTTSNTSFSARLCLSYNSGTTNWAIGPWVTTPTNFYISANAGVQGVYLNGATATSWTAWSDERLKTDLQPIENAVEKVSSLRAVTGVFIGDETNTRKPFLIAQDVLSVLPEAVDTSDSERFGLSYTDVIPLLVAAIKEQQAIITSLTDRITALEQA